MKLATCGFVILLLAPVGTVRAQQQSSQQQQDDLLAAAARRARDQKKQQLKPVKVWTNDDIPKDAGSVSVVGQSGSDNLSASADSPAVTANGENAPGAATPATAKGPASASADKKAAITTDLTAAKENLQTLQNDLDILQRKFTLDQQTYSSRPNYSSDKAGAAALKDEQDQIDAKQQEMLDAQKKIADLQAQLNSVTSANTDSSNTAK